MSGTAPFTDLCIKLRPFGYNSSPANSLDPHCIRLVDYAILYL